MCTEARSGVVLEYVWYCVVHHAWFHVETVLVINLAGIHTEKGGSPPPPQTSDLP